VARAKKVGRAFVEVDAAALDQVLRDIGEAAGAEALRRGREALEQVRTDALPLLPERTGQLRQGVRVVARADAQGAEVALVSDRQGARYIKWSAYTVDQLRQRVEAAAERGQSPEAREAIRRYLAARLRARHGTGAPSEEVAGRRVWRQYLAPAARRVLKPIGADLARYIESIAKR
jgi:hypothetical protein